MAARHYPLHQLFDESGNPLEGGTVQGYEAGTTTPLSIYPTRADAIALTNGSLSVTLPADGSLIIWFVDDTRLKLVIKDSDGVTIPNGTIDNISGEFDLSSSSLTLGGVLNLSQSSNIASAATTNIATGATGNYIFITGTTTITAFGTVQAGAERLLEFQSALTITYHATSLILPGSANIVTVAGDKARMLSLGSGNWVCTQYQRRDGQDLMSRAGADIASAATTDIGAGTGDWVYVTGTTTITSLGTNAVAGKLRWVQFTGILTLTHAANLLLPGVGNIQTAAGDTALFLYQSANVWRCISYMPVGGVGIIAGQSSGNSIRDSADSTKLVRYITSGITTGTTRSITIPNSDVVLTLVQRAGQQTGAVATGTTLIPIDDTIPQNTEGDQYLTISITPKATANILIIQVTVEAACSGAASHITTALFQDSTANALACMVQRAVGANLMTSMTFMHGMSAGTTSATTFNVRIGAEIAGTLTSNGGGAARFFGGVMASRIQIFEYA